MATPNYAFIKRQKDLAKKAKKEEKKKSKLSGDVADPASDEQDEAEVEATRDDQTSPAIDPVGSAARDTPSIQP